MPEYEGSAPEHTKPLIVLPAPREGVAWASLIADPDSERVALKALRRGTRELKKKEGKLERAPEAQEMVDTMSSVLMLDPHAFPSEKTPQLSRSGVLEAQRSVAMNVFNGRMIEEFLHPEGQPNDLSTAIKAVLERNVEDLSPQEQAVYETTRYDIAAYLTFPTAFDEESRARIGQADDLLAPRMDLAMRPIESLPRLPLRTSSGKLSSEIESPGLRKTLLDYNHGRPDEIDVNGIAAMERAGEVIYCMAQDARYQELIAGLLGKESTLPRVAEVIGRPAANVVAADVFVRARYESGREHIIDTLSKLAQNPQTQGKVVEILTDPRVSAGVSRLLTAESTDQYTEANDDGIRKTFEKNRGAMLKVLNDVASGDYRHQVRGLTVSTLLQALVAFVDTPALPDDSPDLQNARRQSVGEAVQLLEDISYDIPTKRLLRNELVKRPEGGYARDRFKNIIGPITLEAPIAEIRRQGM